MPLSASLGTRKEARNGHVSPGENPQDQTPLVTSRISYQLKKCNVFIEPNYRLNISNSFNNKAVIQKYSAFGVNIGLSFDL